jgi:hypothetical protein
MMVEYQPFMDHPVVVQVRRTYGEFTAFRTARRFAEKELKTRGINRIPCQVQTLISPTERLNALVGAK